MLRQKSDEMLAIRGKLTNVRRDDVSFGQDKVKTFSERLQLELHEERNDDRRGS